MAKKKKVIIRGTIEMRGGGGSGGGNGNGDGENGNGNGNGGNGNGNGNGGGNGNGNGNGGPTDPGPGAAVRALQVVRAIALPEDEDLPTHAPTHPGKLVIVKSGKRKGALGWLEKESDIPPHETHEEGEEEKHMPAGHWVPVKPVKAKTRGDSEPEFAFIFHVDEEFGVVHGPGEPSEPEPAQARKPPGR